MENDETHIIHRILKGETSLYEYFLDKYSQQVFILIIRIVENQEDQTGGTGKESGTGCFCGCISGTGAAG